MGADVWKSLVADDRLRRVLDDVVRRKVVRRGELVGELDADGVKAATDQLVRLGLVRTQPGVIPPLDTLYATYEGLRASEEFARSGR